jgi:hypothetical protein
MKNFLVNGIFLFLIFAAVQGLIIAILARDWVAVGIGVLCGAMISTNLQNYRQRNNNKS